MLPNVVQRGAQEVSVRNPGNFDWILESQKEALSGSLFRIQFQEILSLKLHGALCDFVVCLSGEN